MKLIYSYETYLWISLVWMSIGVITFFYLFFKTAPYGRHTREGWGPMIDNKLGWFIMEFTVLIVLYCYFIPIGFRLSLPSWIMVGLFTFHYLNRSFIFPLRIRTHGKKMPLVITLMAIGFNIMNGSLFGMHFAWFSHYSVEWLFDPRFIIGVMIFVTGMTINWMADTRLINLRKPGEMGYKIPHGWLFEYISCPNFFGEIIEWLGFAILTWSVPGVIFFVWTFANLVPRAIAHHKWYKEKFPEYPQQRKAVFPFLW
jgi:hypothetical protein